MSLRETKAIPSAAELVRQSVLMVHIASEKKGRPIVFSASCCG